MTFLFFPKAILVARLGFGTHAHGKWKPSSLSDELQDMIENLPFEKPQDKDDVKKILQLLEARLAEEVNVR